MVSLYSKLVVVFALACSVAAATEVSTYSADGGQDCPAVGTQLLQQKSQKSKMNVSIEELDNEGKQPGTGVEPLPIVAAVQVFSEALPRTTNILHVEFPMPIGVSLLDVASNAPKSHVFHFEVKQDIGCPLIDTDGEEHLQFVESFFQDHSTSKVLFEGVDDCSELKPGVYQCKGSAPIGNEAVRTKCHRVPGATLAEAPHTILNVSVPDSGEDAAFVEKLATYVGSMPVGYAMVLMQPSVLSQVTSVLSPRLQQRVSSGDAKWFNWHTTYNFYWR